MFEILVNLIFLKKKTLTLSPPPKFSKMFSASYSFWLFWFGGVAPQESSEWLTVWWCHFLLTFGHYEEWLSQSGAIPWEDLGLADNCPQKTCLLTHYGYSLAMLSCKEYCALSSYRATMRLKSSATVCVCTHESAPNSSAGGHLEDKLTWKGFRDRRMLENHCAPPKWCVPYLKPSTMITNLSWQGQKTLCKAYFQPGDKS